MRIAKEALTFDDVLLQPDYSDVLPRNVDLTTRLTSQINLNIPFIKRYKVVLLNKQKKRAENI